MQSKINNYQYEIIELYKNKIEVFIETMNEKIKAIEDLEDRNNRLTIFNYLLTSAASMDKYSLQKEFNNYLPLGEDPMVDEMCKTLEEINGFCKETHSHDHEVYQSLFDFKFDLNGKIMKSEIRRELSEQLIALIAEKTNVNLFNASM